MFKKKLLFALLILLALSVVILATKTVSARGDGTGGGLGGIITTLIS